ncbi:glycosyltransferase [Actinophytocola gossypii]|uniref:Glycosyltransferase family 4 protein n=1 Tax=Actinophytocola gossypii TaxID=2812003 RepID=A0ABT2J7M2_9PSEU|nr:glycosyltransferase [Actinophytocola gossypii]MCT2583495.1 glycosyltransferase family 4 protein [Actinophytocola gossypii]
MRVLLWHVHGSWTDAFVRGPHHYLLPTLPERGPWGGGRGGRDWPAEEVPADRLRDTDVDVVVLQRTEELELAEEWLGRRPGRDVPAVFVEHNTPKGAVPNTEHPLADRTDLPIAHVTHFNEWMWDNGRAPTRVIEHGITEPSARYTGELPRAGFVTNEPVRRWRVTGSDLLPRFAEVAPVDVFGMGLDGLTEKLGLTDDRLGLMGDLEHDRLHPELARRRAYLHPLRWTSLGLSLIEAMQIGMPVVCLASTEAVEAVPPEAGILSTRIDVLADGLRELVAEPELAARMGKQAREYALRRYGLARFHADWDRLLADVTP